MKLITVNLSYYNQSKNILYKHINNWKLIPKKIRDLFTFYIIDDCSKINIKNIINTKDIKDLDLHLYRVNEDLYCNIAGVRNLGAKECKTPWMIILDMDTIISPKMAIQVCYFAQKNLNNNIVFKFNRIVPNNNKHIKHNKSHPAVCLIKKKDYWNIGGCEEDLVGHYGYTDPSFWYRAKNKVKLTILNNVNLLYYSEGEANINRNKNHNKKIFELKKKNNNWSKDFIRFKWNKIL